MKIMFVFNKNICLSLSILKWVTTAGEQIEGVYIGSAVLHAGLCTIGRHWPIIVLVDSSMNAVLIDFLAWSLNLPLMNGWKFWGNNQRRP
jgi:hypothetical protein